MAANPVLRYLTAAFNARPIGRRGAELVGMAAFGLLGVPIPASVLGAPRARLPAHLTTNKRFQQTVTARPLSAARDEWNQRIARVLGRLEAADRRTYDALAERCRSIVELQRHDASEAPDGLEQQAESLGRLSWMFLRLLARRTTHCWGRPNDAELQRKIARSRPATRRG